MIIPLALHDHTGRHSVTALITAGAKRLRLVTDFSAGGRGNSRNFLAVYLLVIYAHPSTANLLHNHQLHYFAVAHSFINGCYTNCLHLVRFNFLTKNTLKKTPQNYTFLLVIYAHPSTANLLHNHQLHYFAVAHSFINGCCTNCLHLVRFNFLTKKI